MSTSVVLLFFSGIIQLSLTVPVAWQDELISHHTLASEQDIAQVKVSLGRLVRAAQQTYFGRAFEDEKLTNSVKRPDNGKSGADPTALVNDFSRILFEGDIVLTPKQAEAVLESALAFNKKKKLRVRNKRAALLSDVRYRWTSFPIPYYFDNSLSASDVADIQAAIDFWQSNTCVSYKLTPNPKGDALEFFKGTGCYSMIGRIGDKQGISIGNGCNQLGIVAHEIGHSLGLWHEQSRPDAEQYVRILSENIIGPYISNFLRRDWSDVSLYGVPYDLGSVMHYGSQAFVNDWAKTAIETVQPGYQSTIGQREHPSFYDVKIMNSAYCANTCPKLDCFYGGYANVKDCSQCTCPEGLAGTLCDKPAPSAVSQCGGIINVGSEWTEITSPGYNEGFRYLTGAKCNWLLRSQSGTRVLLEFTDRFQFYCTFTCLDYIEVKNGSDFGTTGMRFCCYAAPAGQFLSERNEMMLLMRTPIGSDVGFKARVRQEPQDSSVSSRTTTTLLETTASRTTAKTTPTSSSSTSRKPTSTTTTPTTTTSSTITSTTPLKTLSTTTPTTTTTTTTTTTVKTTPIVTDPLTTSKITSEPIITDTLTTAEPSGTTGNPTGSKWSSWDSWSDCSKSCGGCGLRTRSRECLTFRCEGPNAQVQRCAFEPCGTKKGQQDDCVKVQHFDYPCGPKKDQICTSADQVTFKCDVPHCCAPLQPIRGKCALPTQDSSVGSWSDWESWSSCKGRQCGGCAQQSRKRTCATPPCVGENTDTRRCNLLPCANCGSFDSSGLIHGSKNDTKCACCSPLSFKDGQCVEEPANDQRLEQ